MSDEELIVRYTGEALVKLNGKLVGFSEDATIRQMRVKKDLRTTVKSEPQVMPEGVGYSFTFYVQLDPNDIEWEDTDE